MKKAFFLAFALMSLTAYAHNEKELQNRAMTWSCNTNSDCTYDHTADGKLLISWRMLPTDKWDQGFDIYRAYSATLSRKLNKEAITNCTCYQDAVSGTIDRTYILKYTGETDTLAMLTIPGESLYKPYRSIKLKTTEDVYHDATLSADTVLYKANDVSIGDLDGDGEQEIIVKRIMGHGSNDGTGAGTSLRFVRHNVIWDAYKQDGTFLWRVMSGPSILLGNSSCFAVADFDGDGCCELAMKTGEGTVFGDGTEIGDTNNDGKTDYRTWTGGWVDHYNSAGPEFLSIIDGKTGRELARDKFIDRETSEAWGDGYWKRANSLRVGVAYCDGVLPSVVIGRGVYALSIVEAWDWRDNQMTKRWRFDSREQTNSNMWTGQGNHQFITGDVDGDGCDEIVYGAMTVGNNGEGHSTTGLEHGDAIHMGRFDPDREGLQIWGCYEHGKTMAALRDAKDDAIIFKLDAAEANDMGRCCIGDIDSASPGCEMWYYNGEPYTPKGVKTGRAYPGSTNFCIWWTGSLNRQLFDGTQIDSYNPAQRKFTIYKYGVTSINGTKKNPSWYGDLTGDWREEIIEPTSDLVSEIRIFTTWFPTLHRFPWLQTDHTYYMSCLNQQIGYNTQTNLGYYLGSDLDADSDIEKYGYVKPDYQSGISTFVHEMTNQSVLNDNSYYDLQGRRVEHPEHGIYIRNGKKIVIK